MGQSKIKESISISISISTLHMFSKFRKIAWVEKQQGQYGNFENTSEINP
jgi:hypothetical protein